MFVVYVAEMSSLITILQNVKFYAFMFMIYGITVIYKIISDTFTQVTYCFGLLIFVCGFVAWEQL